MKKPRLPFHFIIGVALLALVPGCASTKVMRTEQMLTEAGFRPVAARTDKQAQHLQTLPADRLTVATLNGKTFYVFPDPAHHRIYVGNAEQYQTYQQVLTYNQLEGGSRVLAAEDGGGDADKWVEWTNTTGWTYGSD